MIRIRSIRRKETENVKKKMAILLPVLLLLGGCSLKEAPPLNIYTLTTPKAVVVAKSPYHNRVLKVSFPLSIQEPLSYKMTYSYGMHERGYYQNSQWSNSIGKLIQGNLIKTLQRSRLYKAVLPFQSSVPEDMRLESVVYDLCHYIRGDDSYAVVSIEFALVDMRSGKLIKSRRFTYKEPTPSVDAAGYATAVNHAMERLSIDLPLWIR